MPPRPTPRRTLPALALACLVALAALAGCAGSSGSAPRGTVDVVAAENVWGSIARQIAGHEARVRSIVVDPGTDPHDYQPTAQDARTVAGARLAIVDGIGYDRWMSQLLAASPARGRVVLDVGDLLGLREGDNPHQWYAPGSVHRVVRRIVADLGRLDPAHAASFARRGRAFETRSLARYDALRREIHSRYAGVPVGYSESVFAPLGHDLGLRLLTPPSFAKAISEGADVSARDKQTVDRQAQERLIKVWIVNSQNLTPDVQRVDEIARARHVPIVTVTETLTPASASFQAWQVSELERLWAALHRATGR